MVFFFFAGQVLLAIHARKREGIFGGGVFILLFLLIY